jgi:hypothetical protein
MEGKVLTDRDLRVIGHLQDSWQLLSRTFTGNIIDLYPHYFQKMQSVQPSLVAYVA